MMKGLSLRRSTPRRRNQLDYDYAKQLCLSIYNNHFVEPGGKFEPFGDLQGVLSQIDNMVAGMCRKNLGANLTAELLLAIKRQQAAVSAVRKVFGPPGDYGYGHPQGKAILELYKSHNGLSAAVEKFP